MRRRGKRGGREHGRGGEQGEAAGGAHQLEFSGISVGSGSDLNGRCLTTQRLASHAAEFFEPRAINASPKAARCCLQRSKMELAAPTAIAEYAGIDRAAFDATIRPLGSLPCCAALAPIGLPSPLHGVPTRS